MEESEKAGAAESGDGASNDVHIVEIPGKRVVLVGTAHVSRESADRVREVIEAERPDRVCVELDSQRHAALSQKTRWEELDLRQIIRRKQLATLIVQLLLASFQKKIGGQLGVEPGTELLEATRVADELGIPYSLSDREIRITLLRAWRGMSAWQKAKLAAGLLAGAFEDVELSEDELRELREKDTLSELMEGLAREMPTLKRVLIDERDRYLAENIRSAEGERIVAVVGAGHVAGLTKILHGPAAPDLEPLRTVPAASRVAHWIGWGIPAVILGSLAIIFATKGSEVAGQNAMFWILANGIPSALGAVAALAHPLTILAALVAAPLTSLTPVIGAGYVTAFVQAYLVPPKVRDFRSVTEDAGHLKRWWRNRLLRVLLAFILPTIGSVIGTYVGGYEILSNLF